MEYSANPSCETQLKTICSYLNITIEIISIEGSIGSGKSTLCKMLKNYFTTFNEKSSQTYNAEYHFVDEPVDEWENIRDKTQENKNMLELFYENQAKYSFVFQITAYITRLQIIKNKIEQIIKNRKDEIERKQSHPLIMLERKKYILITERSLQTDCNVFAKMLFDDGKINEIEWQSYNYWFNNFASEYGVDRIIYVRVEPEISFERTKKRNRNGEETIPLEYLEKCHRYHETWINGVDKKNKRIFNASKSINTEKKVDLNYIIPILKLITCNWV
jgi:deoxyadenosine/deoxycytidine kinase